MKKQIEILVALDGEVDRGLIETLVSRDPRVSVIDYLELDGPSASKLGAGDALVVAVADYADEVRDFVATAHRQHPSRPIILACPPSGNGYVSEAFSSGVDDIVPLPTDPLSAVDAALARQLVFSLEKALMRKGGRSEATAVDLRNVICVLGPKGGSGKTLTATNLGVAIAQAGRSVCLLDLDLQFGDLALAMGLNPVRTIYDLVRSGGSLDAGKLADFLVEHPSGAHALLAPISPDQAAAITVPFLVEALRLLAEMHEFVVIDTPPSFTPEVIGAIDASTDVVMVAMRDTLSLKNTKLGLETLERMEYDRRRVRLVLNRANTNVGIERDDVLAILGRDVDILIPSDRNIAVSVNQGTPITMQRGSEAGKAFRALAKFYLDRAAAADSRPAPANGRVPATDGPAAKAPRESIILKKLRSR